MSVSDPDPSVRRALFRGLKGRCPHCGDGRLFARRLQVATCCSECGLPFEPRTGDQFGLIYLSTAAVTVAAFMLLISLRPSLSLPAKVAMVAGGVAVMLLTYPARKGLAVAVDYLIDRSS